MSALPLLGELLLEQGVITSDQLEIALTEHKRHRERLGSSLVRLGFVSEEVITAVLGGLLGAEPLDLKQVVPDPEAVAMLPARLAQDFQVLPICYKSAEQVLVLATADPQNLMIMDELGAQLGGQVQIEPMLVGENELSQALDRHYGHPLLVDQILQEMEQSGVQTVDTSGDYRQPVVRLVNALLMDALKQGASDIHLEPKRGFVRLRYRIDGVLRQIRSLHQDRWSAILVRIKIMAGLDIAEHRVPQDGRISLRLGGHLLDFRVSTLPSVHGESLVLRVLDRDRGVLSLDALELDAKTLAALQRMLQRPEGVLLISGPTGSGKTSTLYAILNHLSSEQVNIITLEDPVEYALPAARQCSLNELVQLDFAAGVRTLLRQDPDIILIGEIRDEETAHMTLRAAMTGHRVFSTLHTGSAAAAVPRLLEMGVPADLLADHLVGVLAQRLVRRLCTVCRRAWTPGRQARQLLRIEQQNSEPSLYQAVGCTACAHTGYQGRLAILEALRVDAELSAAIARRQSLPHLLEQARSSGFQPLAEAGRQRVLDGSTDLRELRRVVDLGAG